MQKTSDPLAPPVTAAGCGYRCGQPVHHPVTNRPRMHSRCSIHSRPAAARRVTHRWSPARSPCSAATMPGCTQHAQALLLILSSLHRFPFKNSCWGFAPTRPVHNQPPPTPTGTPRQPRVSSINFHEGLLGSTVGDLPPLCFCRGRCTAAGGMFTGRRGVELDNGVTRGRYGRGDHKRGSDRLEIPPGPG